MRSLNSNDLIEERRGKMITRERNTIEFKVCGKFALFSDPITRVGGEKSTYLVPTYQALKGIVESIYWKPTIVWVIDRVRVMKTIKTQSKGVCPVLYSEGGRTLANYTYLKDVEYRVQAHFEWNLNRSELEFDRNEHKHHNMAKRKLAVGGARDVFLGTRECQAYVEPCVIDEGTGDYDDYGEIDFGLMFHSFSYPDETGKDVLQLRFWKVKMVNGYIEFIRPEECTIVRDVRPMEKKIFDRSNVTGVDELINDEERW